MAKKQRSIRTMGNKIVTVVSVLAGIATVIGLGITLSDRTAGKTLPLPELYVHYDANGDGRGDPKRKRPHIEGDEIPHGWVTNADDPDDLSPLVLSIPSILEFDPRPNNNSKGKPLRITLSAAVDGYKVQNSKISIDLPMRGYSDIIQLKGTSGPPPHVFTNEMGGAEIFLRVVGPWPIGVSSMPIVCTYEPNSPALIARDTCSLLVVSDAL